MPRNASKTKCVRPFSCQVYVLTGIGLALAGLLVSVSLSISHYRVYTDLTYRSFCAISKAINCDTVSQSPYSIFWALPVPVWGCIGYAGLAGLILMTAVPAGGCRRMWALSFVVTCVFSSISIVLAAVSTYRIGSYCILCIVTYAINLMLLYLSWIARRRFDSGAMLAALGQDVRFAVRFRKVTLPLSVLLVLVVLSAYRLIPPYWVFDSPAAGLQVARGTTEEGLPFVGAEQPEVTITEFADYQCFQCRKMHYYLRALVARFPEKLRLVHRHYPMDHEVNFIVNEPFHVGSGRMALLAIHAETKGKFWQMNDVLYDLGGRGKDLDLRDIAFRMQIDARELGAALHHPYYRDRLKLDIGTGMKLRILGTPSYVIDGKVYQGSIPPEVMGDILRRLEPA